MEFNSPPGNRVSLYLSFHTSNFVFIFWHDRFFLPYFVSVPRRVLLSRTERVTGCDLRSHIIAPSCRCPPGCRTEQGLLPSHRETVRKYPSHHEDHRAPASPRRIMRCVDRSGFRPRRAAACSLSFMGQRTCNPDCSVFKVRISKTICLKFDRGSDHSSILLMVWELSVRLGYRKQNHCFLQIEYPFDKRLSVPAAGTIHFASVTIGNSLWYLGFLNNRLAVWRKKQFKKALFPVF